MSNMVSLNVQPSFQTSLSLPVQAPAVRFAHAQDTVQFAGKKQAAGKSALDITDKQQQLLDAGSDAVRETIEQQFPLKDIVTELRKNQSLFNDVADKTWASLDAGTREATLQRLAKYAQLAAFVQQFEEGKQPALPILKAFIDKGINVVGVPVPPIEQGKALAENPTFHAQVASVLPQEQAKAIQSVIDQKNLIDTSLPNKVGEEGFGVSQTLTGIEMAKQVGVGISTFLGVNNGLAAEAISKLGTEEQQAFWLNQMAQGKLTFAFGLTGPEAGSDPRNMRATFERVEGKNGEVKYRLNGSKKFIGNAARVLDKEGNVTHRGADFIVVFAVDSANKGPEERSFRAFLVPRTLIGEDNIRPTGGEHGKTGLNEVNNGDFDMINVEIPESFMLGKSEAKVRAQVLAEKPELADTEAFRKSLLAADPQNTEIQWAADEAIDAQREQAIRKAVDDQMDIFPTLRKTLDETRQFVGTMGQGTVEAALDIARTFANLRIVNGRRVSDFPIKQETFDKLQGRALAGRLLLMESGRKIDLAAQQRKRGEKPIVFTNDTSMAKLYCTELAEQAATFAKDTLGGVGFIKPWQENFGIEKRLRDSHVLTVYEGSSDIQRNLIAKGALITEGKTLGKTGMLKVFGRKALGSHLKPGGNIVEEAYRFAVTDCMLKLKAESAKVNAKWKANGVPKQFEGWDADSLKREREAEAFFRWQGRLFILADLATNRHLYQLAEKELDVLNGKQGLSDQEKENQRLLNVFKDDAELKATQLYEAYKQRYQKGI